MDFEPGIDFVQGPELGYSNLYLASHSLEIKATYLTNRPEKLFRDKNSRQDLYLFSPVWHFRRNSSFDPLARLDFGYANREAGGWVGSAQFGLNLNLSRAQWGLFGHAGYTYLTPRYTKDLPWVFAMGIWTLL